MTGESGKAGPNFPSASAVDGHSDANYNSFASDIFKFISPLLNTIFPYVVLLFAVTHWGVAERLIDRIEYLKIGEYETRLSVARVARVTRDALDRHIHDFTTSNNGMGKPEKRYFDAALRLYLRVAPAVNGARILWVDPHPQNQRIEREAMERLGIRIDVERDTSGAVRRIEENHYDLVLSNIGTASDKYADQFPQRPLNYCPASFLIPQPDRVQTRPGVIRAEAIVARDPAWFNPAHPRIIFYSARGTGVVADGCARLITNRADILLEAVVSALAELRFEELPSIDQEGNATKNSENAADRDR